MSKNLLKSVLCLTLGAIFALSGTTFADDSFEYHGYMRTGQVMNEKLAKAKSNLGANDAGASYRLGNEPENTYIENSFVKNWKDDDGTFMKFVFMAAWTGNERQNFANESTNTGILRQSYVQGGGFAFAPEMKVWAGSRYYAREDIHINDFYYRDLSAYGAGFEDINLGFSKLNIAWLTTGKQDDDEANRTAVDSDGYDIGGKVSHVFDVQLNEIALPGGSLNVEGSLHYLVGGEDEDTGLMEANKTGFYGQVSYNMASFVGMGGFLKIVGQYGKGVAGNGSGLGNAAQGVYGDNATVDDESRMRGIIWGVMEASQELAIMPVIIYDYYDDGDVTTRTWMSFGARVKYSMNRNFAMQLEVGHDMVTTDVDGEETKPALTKVTLAPTFTFDTGFWTRPEIRFFVTYATWNDDEGEGANGATADDKKNATLLGFQAEAWW